MNEGCFPGLPVPSPVRNTFIRFCSLQLLGLSQDDSDYPACLRESLYQAALASKLELTQVP